MMEWWRAREPREQALIAVAGFLTALVVLFQGVLAPLSSANTRAEDRHLRAAESLDDVRAGLLAVNASSGTANPASAPADGLDFRTAVTTLARARGLQISRLQSGEGGGLTVTMDDADPRLLFAWLLQIQARPGGDVRAATITQRGGGAVRATVEFEGVG
ncbi:MAG: type II secretion system protein GspM [Pseudomonadota bacterium]